MKKLTFGQWFHAKRQQANITQREIADALEYGTPQFISNWERDISMPPLAAAPKIAVLLGTNTNQVLGMMHHQKREALDKEFLEAKKAYK